MSYNRIYAQKNNTIFYNNRTNYDIVKNGNVNTGQNPIMELYDGNAESIPVFYFDLSSVKDKLNKYNFTANIKLFDAGAIWEPTLPLKKLELIYFEEDFVEGKGYKFFGEDAFEGVSNWNYRNNNNDDWDGVVKNNVNVANTYQLNFPNEDVEMDVTSNISTSLNNNINPKFGLRVNNHGQNVDGSKVYGKFFRSRHTRNIFKPYIEFYIDDEVNDDSLNSYANNKNSYYIKKVGAGDFSGNVGSEITHPDGSKTSISPTKIEDGIYKIDYTPPISEGEDYIFVNWDSGGEPIDRTAVLVRNPDKVQMDKDEEKGLFFYPQPNYKFHNIRKNDVVKFNIISEIRGRGEYIDSKYEYRVIATNGFEIIPWRRASIYKDEIYFIIDTSFFFEYIQYEVFIRRVRNDGTKETSDYTYKFTLDADDPTHLDNKHASPYSNRDWIFNPKG